MFKRIDCFGLCCAPIPKPRLPAFLGRLARRLRRHSATVVPVRQESSQAATNLDDDTSTSTPVIRISSGVELTEQVDPTVEKAEGRNTSNKLFVQRQRNRNLDSDYVVIPRTELHNPHIAKTRQSSSEAESEQFDVCLPGQISDTQTVTSGDIEHVTILDDDEGTFPSQSSISDLTTEQQPSAEYLEQCARDNLQLAKIARLVNTCPDSFVRRTLIQMNTTGHLIYKEILLALQQWSSVGHRAHEIFQEWIKLKDTRGKVQVHQCTTEGAGPLIQGQVVRFGRSKGNNL